MFWPGGPWESSKITLWLLALIPEGKTHRYLFEDDRDVFHAKVRPIGTFSLQVKKYLRDYLETSLLKAGIVCIYTGIVTSPKSVGFQKKNIPPPESPQIL